MSRPESKAESTLTEPKSAELAIAHYDWKALKRLTIDPKTNTAKTKTGLLSKKDNAYWKAMYQRFFDSELDDDVDDDSTTYYLTFVSRYSTVLDQLQTRQLQLHDLPKGFTHDIAAVFIAERAIPSSLHSATDRVLTEPMLWQMLINYRAIYAMDHRLPPELLDCDWVIAAEIKAKFGFGLSILDLSEIPLNAATIKCISAELKQIKSKPTRLCLNGCSLDELFDSKPMTPCRFHLPSRMELYRNNARLLANLYAKLPSSIKSIHLDSNQLGFVPNANIYVRFALSALPKHIHTVTLTNNQLAYDDGSILEIMLDGLTRFGSKQLQRINLTYNQLGSLPIARLESLLKKIPSHVTHLSLDHNQLDHYTAAELERLINAIPFSVVTLKLGNNFGPGSDLDKVCRDLLATRTERIREHSRVCGGGGGGAGHDSEDEVTRRGPGVG